jgi:hypothetical protein
MAKNTTKLRSFLSLFLVIGPASILIFISTRSCDHNFKHLEDYGLIKTDSFEVFDPQTSTFQQKSLSDFEGEIVILNTLQPSCPTDCKISLWHFNQMIYKHIFENKHKKLKKVRIISFLTNLQGENLRDKQTFSNTIESIKNTQSDKNYDPSLWMLARGNAHDLFDINHNGENLIQGSERDYGKNAYLRYLLLLDKKSHLRMVLPGNKEGETRRFFQSIALLQKEYSLSKK